MNVRIKSIFQGLFFVSVLLAASTVFMIPRAFATGNPSDATVNKLAPAKVVKIVQVKHKYHKHKKNAFGGLAWAGISGKHGNKHLTVDDAKKIATAALVWYGQRDLQVAKVNPKTNKKGKTVYMIDLQNNHNEFVRQVVMNPRTGGVHLVQ